MSLFRRVFRSISVSRLARVDLVCFPLPEKPESASSAKIAILGREKLNKNCYLSSKPWVENGLFTLQHVKSHAETCPLEINYFCLGFGAVCVCFLGVCMLICVLMGRGMD